MGRFLFTCHDAGGTVPPVLAVAKAIVDRGHAVTILSQPSVATRAAAIGCEFIGFSEANDYRRDLALEEQLDRTLPVLVGHSIGADVLAAAEDADVVVVDPNLAGALAAAERLEQPSAVLLHSLFRTFVDVWFGELWPLLAEPINSTRRRFGADDATGWADMLGRHDLIVSPVPPVFDAPLDDPPARIDHVGFLVPDAVPVAEVELPPGDDPLVAISFSTTYQHQERALRETLAALAHEPVRVVATTSGYANAADPPRNAIVTDVFVPHSLLFEHVDVVLTHGGLGTVSAALRSGSPLLCLPMGRDQHLNAGRAAALGAGLIHPNDIDRSLLRQHVRALLENPEYRTNATAIAAASRHAGEAERAALALEHLVDQPAARRSNLHERDI